MSLAEYPQVAERRPDQESVTELVTGFRDTRDSVLFGRLFERYRPMLRSHILALGIRDEHGREDLLQDVFLQALRKIDNLKEPAAFGSWIRSIATRMNINRNTRKRAAFSVDNGTLDTFSPVDDALTAEICSLQKERSRIIRSALNRMKEVDHAMLHQFYLERLSLLEMVERNDCPIGTIKRRLHTARKRLGELLGEYGIVDAVL